MGRNELIRDIVMTLLDMDLLNQADYPDTLHLTAECQDVIKHKIEDLIIIKGEVIE